MYKTMSTPTFVRGAILPKYAPPYSPSKVIINRLVTNGFMPSMETGLVFTEGNLRYFPRADVVPVSTLLAYLGYTRKHILDLRITSGCLKLIPAGMGGINNGIMYWLNKINQELSMNCTHNMQFHAFDDDTWDASNIPRIHLPSLGVKSDTWKTEWVAESLRKQQSLIALRANTTRVPIKDLKAYKTDVPPIVFGATGTSVRSLLSKSKDCVYLQITHSEHNLNMYINPDNPMKSWDIYGTIYLNEFHMMTLKAAVTLLEVAKRHSVEGISTVKEEKVELFNIQDFDKKYGADDSWLGVVPKGIKYNRYDNVYM